MQNDKIRARKLKQDVLFLCSGTKITTIELHMVHYM